MSTYPFAPNPALALQASNGSFPLPAGGGTACSWTAPDDGQLHWAQAFAAMTVAAALTGGAVTFTVNPVPTGGPANESLYNAGQAAGTSMSYGPMCPVAPGATVSISTGAVTGGSAALSCGIWGV